jgi:hypothetical protein
MFNFSLMLHALFGAGGGGGEFLQTVKFCKCAVAVRCHMRDRVQETRALSGID